MTPKDGDSDVAGRRDEHTQPEPPPGIIDERAQRLTSLRAELQTSDLNLKRLSEIADTLLESHGDATLPREAQTQLVGAMEKLVQLDPPLSYDTCEMILDAISQRSLDNAFAPDMKTKLADASQGLSDLEDTKGKGKTAKMTSSIPKNQEYVTLNNISAHGEQIKEPKIIVDSTFTTLKRLWSTGTKGIPAIYDAREFCRNSTYKISEDSRKKLQGIIQESTDNPQDVSINDSVKNVVLSAVQGEKGDMHLVKPYGENVRIHPGNGEVAA